MCTVTFIPTTAGGLLTSSRDERIIRQTTAPVSMQVGNRKLLFPKDELAGGSWIAASDDFRFACLLNGAFEDHKNEPYYRKSRGLVLVDSFHYETTDAFIRTYDFEGIEPFTLLLLTQHTNLSLIELRWDGTTLFQQFVDTQQAHIWSSATLYSSEIRTQRKRFFEQWVVNNSDKEFFDMLNFHQSKHEFATEDAILMERSDGLRTMSISQLFIQQKTVDFHYHDLIRIQSQIETINRN